MQATWVVVADHDCATIYSVPRGMARLRRICELQRARTSQPDAGSERSAEESCSLDPACGKVDRQARHFATRVARHVEDACRERRFDELILMVAPGFLEHLRESLSQGVRAVVVAEVAKNLVGVPPEKLQEQVLRVL